MRTALAEDDAFDGSATAWARLAGSAVDVVLELIVAAGAIGIDVV